MSENFLESFSNTKNKQKKVLIEHSSCFFYKLLIFVFVNSWGFLAKEV